MSNRSTLLLEHHLKELRLPTFLREYRKLAAQCAAENVDHPDYLLRLSELELIDRHQRMVQRRIRAARFPAVKSLDTFDFLAIPSVNKQLVMELARCEYIEHRENVIAVGNSGTGKTHVALDLGLAACQKGMSVGFTTAAALVHELMEARDDRRLLNLQRQLARLRLLIIDELGFVPLSTTGAELLFEVFSQRYERGSVLVTTNLPLAMEPGQTFQVAAGVLDCCVVTRPVHATDGEYTVTWRMLEFYIDLSGTYEFDTATGAIEFNGEWESIPTAGFSGTGSYRLEPDGSMILEGICSGGPDSKSGEGEKVCTHRFTPLS